MKLKHRRAHLILWIILAPLILLGLYKGITSRSEFPIEQFAPQTKEIFLDVAPMRHEAK